MEENLSEMDSDSLARAIMDHAFEFPHGIIGFSEFRKFVFAQTPEERPFAWMRSLEDPNLSFAVVDAFYLKPDYSVYLDDKELELIGSPGALDCFILFIIRVDPGPPFRIYANMKAPLVLNRVARKAMQFIVHDSPFKEDAMFEL